MVPLLVVGDRSPLLAEKIPTEIPTGTRMRLNDTFIKNSTKHSGRASGDKHTDGGGLYLHVNGAGKYWRMNYRFAAKQKTLSLGVYPALSLANARKGREKAREMLSQGMDPSTEKQDAKQAQKMAMVSTFEAVAREFHGIKAVGADVYLVRERIEKYLIS
jgi:hypothetical protein